MPQTHVEQPDAALDAARQRAPEPPAPDPRSAHVLALQRGAGNAAVARLLVPPAPVADDHRIAFTAVIRRSDAPPAPAATGGGALAAASDHDAAPGNEAEGTIDPGAVTAALQSSAPPAEASSSAEGERVALPDMRVPPELVPPDTDPVNSTITYSGSVAQSGTVSPFGATSWATFNVTGATVTPNSGTFVATFTLENPITYNVAAGGRTHITSENDAALTNANYATAASDLTPNMSDLGGRPPRTSFWAQDLTLRHEGFHANERRGFASAGASQAQTWLNTQTASSVGDVQTLIAQVPGRVITASQASAGTVAVKEARAYGDGAPLYKARADAITAKGALGPSGGGYP